MESEQSSISPDSAAARLQGHAEVRAKVVHRGPSRALSLLQLWEAVATAAVLGAFLFAFGGRALTSVAHYSLSVLVFPIIVLNILVRGARERFSIRKKPSPTYWVAYAIIVVAISMLAMTSAAYPWWLNLLTPGVLFIVMAAGPIRQLRSAGIADTQRWVNEPLNRSARWTTAMIGVAMGLVVVFDTQPWLDNLSLAVLLPLLIAAPFIPWLPTTGAEWGPIHWVAHGIVTSLFFALGVLLARTSWVAAPVSVAAGVFAVLIMILAAFLPRPTSGN